MHGCVRTRENKREREREREGENLMCGCQNELKLVETEMEEGRVRKMTGNDWQYVDKAVQ